MAIHPTDIASYVDWLPGDAKAEFLDRLSGASVPAPPPESPLPAVTHYASPTGGGDGLSEGSPFLISDFMALPDLTAGYHLQLADGVYTGDSSMIATPGVNGTEADRILVSAKNDGAVRLDGEGVRDPFDFNDDYWWVQGINARNGGRWIGSISGNFNILRRVVMWDADTALNNAVLQTSNCWGNLIEDCAGFGNGRRIFSSYESGDGDHTLPGNTYRRCWGMGRYWEGTTKNVFQIGYQGYNDIAENCVGMYDEEGAAWPDDWRAIFIIGRNSKKTPIEQHAAYIGSIAVLLAENDAPKLKFLGQGFGGEGEFDESGGNEFKDCAFYTERLLKARSSGERRMMSLQHYQGDPGKYTNITEIDTAGNDPYSDENWIVTNRVQATSVAGAPSPFQTTTGSGARVYYRTVDGELTTDLLWPWPMDARIRAALTTSGRDPDVIFRASAGGDYAGTVTGLMESIFGAIPGI